MTNRTGYFVILAPVRHPGPASRESGPAGAGFLPLNERLRFAFQEDSEFAVGVSFGMRRPLDRTMGSVPHPDRAQFMQGLARFSTSASQYRLEDVVRRGAINVRDS